MEIAVCKRCMFTKKWNSDLPSERTVGPIQVCPQKAVLGENTVVFKWISKLIRFVQLILLYFAHWLVSKLAPLFSTNEKRRLNVIASYSYWPLRCLRLSWLVIVIALVLALFLRHSTITYINWLCIIYARQTLIFQCFFRTYHDSKDFVCRIERNCYAVFK